MGDPYGAGALLGLRKFLLLQRCTPFTRLLLLMSRPNQHDRGYMLQGLDDPTASLLATTVAADVDLNFLRLKRAQARGCFYWKRNPGIKQ